MRLRCKIFRVASLWKVCAPRYVAFPEAAGGRERARVSPTIRLIKVDPPGWPMPYVVVIPNHLRRPLAHVRMRGLWTMLVCDYGPRRTWTIGPLDHDGQYGPRTTTPSIDQCGLMLSFYVV